MFWAPGEIPEDKLIGALAEMHRSNEHREVWGSCETLAFPMIIHVCMHIYIYTHTDTYTYTYTYRYKCTNTNTNRMQNVSEKWACFCHPKWPEFNFPWILAGLIWIWMGMFTVENNPFQRTKMDQCCG